MTNVLNIEASKALSDLGVEVESEKWWVQNTYTRSGDYPKKHYDWHIERDEVAKSYKVKYPAPSFSELLLALEEIGKKLGWNAEPFNVSAFNKRMDEWEYKAHKLVATFLSSGGDMEGAVSAEVLELIK